MFEKIFITAEAGSNHNGNLNTAVELVYKAKEAGADAIKFQSFSLHGLFSPPYYEKALGIKNSTWQKKIEEAQFRPGWHKVIAEKAEKAGICYFSTPFSPEAVDILDQYVPFYKIASGDITFTPLLEKVASKGKGVFISTGAARLEEIDTAVSLMRNYNLPFICIMHCVMLYPPPDDALHLHFIDTLKKRYNLPVGFSDHTQGIDAPLISVGKGIRALEKHFTLDTHQEGFDHKNSLDPNMFSTLVKKVRSGEAMLGNNKKVITEKEAKERVYARRGVYAGKTLQRGERITLEKVRFLRPNSYIDAEKISELLGRVLTTDVAEGTALEYSMFE